MRRALNDKLTVQLPQGARSFEITRIEYRPRAGE
jgi:transcription elongation GreA/GreB family factor